MLLRQFHLRNNFPTHIKENTGFLRQKPRQMPSAEANFEGWNNKTVIYFTLEISLLSVVPGETWKKCDKSFDWLIKKKNSPLDIWFSSFWIPNPFLKSWSSPNKFQPSNQLHKSCVPRHQPKTSLPTKN